MTLDFWTVTYFIAFFGFFGGVVSFIAFCIYSADGGFRDEFRTTPWPALLFGIFSGVVGIAGALAIQVLLVGMRFYDKDKPTASDFIYLAAICLIGGFAARSFLSQVTQMFAKQIEQQVKEVKQTAERAEDLSEKQMRQFVVLASTHEKSPPEVLEYIVRTADLALKKTPNDPMFLITKGAALKRLGKVKEAIETITPYIEANLSASKADKYISTAFFNRACYRALLGKVGPALEDLKRALELSENVEDDKRGAAEDEDFVSLKDNPQFVNLTSTNK